MSAWQLAGRNGDEMTTKTILFEATEKEITDFVKFKRQGLDEMVVDQSVKASVNRLHKRFFIILQKEMRA